MSKIQTFKQELARVFDDNLHTKQWHNYVDYAIIGLIILSTVEVFLSTYDGIVEKYGLWLKVVDYFTTAFFTIEVSLRIWCADLIDDKYKGFWGRVRYCFSFYGLIDILSTYPFYLHFFMPVPYVALKALRIARLMRVFRYLKAFNVLSRAMRAKKDEMWVSVQFLTIITLILSFILFFVEHDGCCIDRGSKVTIVATSNYAEAATGTFAYYLAKIGGFNYVSKEIELDILNPVTYYNITDEQADTNLPIFLSDINRLANTEDHWVIFILGASGNVEPEYPTQFHYVIGKAKGDETYDDPRITIQNIPVFDALYKDLSASIAQQFDLQSDCQKYHTCTSPKNIARHIVCPNAFTIRIAWSVLCWDYRYLQIAQTMATSIRQQLALDEPEPDLSDILNRQQKDCGYCE